MIFGAGNGATGRLLTHPPPAGHSDDPAHSAPRPRAVDRRGGCPRPRGSVASPAGADAAIPTLGVPFTRESVDTYSVWHGQQPPPPRPTTRLRRRRPDRCLSRPRTPPFALRIFEPVITRTIGKTAYDDMRPTENPRAR